MSINTDPALYNYQAPGGACLACFGLNTTPAAMFMAVTGIQIGALWLPGDPPPPNGIFTMQPFAPCVWRLATGTYTFVWNPQGGFLHCTIGVVGVGSAFADSLGAGCNYLYDNIQVAPAGQHYFGGTTQILPPLEGGANSLPETLALFSDDPVWAKWANPKPIDETQTVHQFYRRRDRTRIKIKVTQ